MALERDRVSLQAQIKQILREEITDGVWRQGPNSRRNPG